MHKAKRLFAVAACSLTVAALGAGSALAGEITGSGKWIAGSEAAPLNGNSFCAYSGLNDNYVLGNLKTDADGNLLPDADGFTHNQNWGHVSKEDRAFLTSIGLNPGMACNPNKTTFGEP
jgi:hypothetical protein